MPKDIYMNAGLTCNGDVTSDNVDMGSRNTIQSTTNVENLDIMNNAYFDGSTWRRKVASKDSSLLELQERGSQYVSIYQSDPAGDSDVNGEITWQQVMSLGSGSGPRVGINGKVVNGVAGAVLYVYGDVRATEYKVNSNVGAAITTFTTNDGKTVTVEGGIITSVV